MSLTTTALLELQERNKEIDELQEEIKRLKAKIKLLEADDLYTYSSGKGTFFGYETFFTRLRTETNHKGLGDDQDAIKFLEAKVTLMSDNGKGDRQRPVDKDQYDKNYETIKWDKRNDVLHKLSGPDPWHHKKGHVKWGKRNDVLLISSLASFCFNSYLGCAYSPTTGGP